MTEQWKQFSLYPAGCRNKTQPVQVLYKFLPEFLAEHAPGDIWRWHILFEPSALIRIKSKDPAMSMIVAKTLAKKCGLVFEAGDCSKDLNPDLKYHEAEYGGEVEFYGEKLWKANTKYMQACGELAIEIVKLGHQEQTRMMWKFNHLFWNTLGLNFLEETAMSQVLNMNNSDMYHRYGRS